MTCKRPTSLFRNTTNIEVNITDGEVTSVKLRDLSDEEKKDLSDILEKGSKIERKINVENINIEKEINVFGVKLVKLNNGMYFGKGLEIFTVRGRKLYNALGDEVTNRPDLLSKVQAGDGALVPAFGSVVFVDDKTINGNNKINVNK